MSIDLTAFRYLNNDAPSTAEFQFDSQPITGPAALQAQPGQEASAEDQGQNAQTLVVRVAAGAMEFGVRVQGPGDAKAYRIEITGGQAIAQVFDDNDNVVPSQIEQGDWNTGNFRFNN